MQINDCKTKHKPDALGLRKPNSKMNHTYILHRVTVLENIVLEKQGIYYDIFNENSCTMTLKTYKHLKKQLSFIC